MEKPNKKFIRNALAAVAMSNLPTVDSPPKEPEQPVYSQEELRTALFEANPFIFGDTSYEDATSDESLELRELSAYVDREDDEDVTSYAERLAQISRYLHFSGLEITTENIVEAQIEIVKHREKYADYPLLQPKTFLAAGADEEEGSSRFASEFMLEGLENQGVQVEVLSSFSDNVESSAELARANKIKLLEGIAVSTEESITVFLNTHGARESIYLGPVDETKHAKESFDSNISPQELAEALIARAQQKDGQSESKPDVIILSTCYSGSFGVELQRILAEKNIPLPIIVTATETDQYGLTLFQRKLAKSFSEEEQFTVGKFIDDYKNHDATIGSNPVVLVPNSNNQTSAVQIG